MFSSTPPGTDNSRCLFYIPFDLFIRVFCVYLCHSFEHRIKACMYILLMGLKVFEIVLVGNDSRFRATTTCKNVGGVMLYDLVEYGAKIAL